MEELILFIVSALPIFLLGRYIYVHDRNKESGRLLTKLFLGGILSCFLVLIVSGILGFFFPIFNADEDTLNLFQLIIYVFIGIALVEEVCKWVMSYFIAFNDSEFEEAYDMIVYSAFVALGFAFFENLLYVYDNGVGVGVLRALLAVPGHACDGVFMGYYLGLAKLSSLNNRNDLKNKNLILSILVPTLMHGFYDYCLFTGNWVFIILFFVFVIFVYVHSVKKIKQMSSINRKMKYRDNYCTNCGYVVNSNFCPKCGKKHE